jgi:hypothetical protein
MSNNIDPNDDFKLNAQLQAEAKAQQAIAEASTSLKVESQIQVDHAGSSRRVTRLLSAAFDVLLRVWVMFSSIPWTLKRGIGGLLSLILGRLIHFALAHPTLKARALTLVLGYPALEEWLYRFAVARGLVTGATMIQIYPDPSRLTPSALLIYADLKAAIVRHNKRG